MSRRKIEIDFTGTVLDWDDEDHKALEAAILENLAKRSMQFGVLYANLADTFPKFKERRSYTGVIEFRIHHEKRFLRNALNRLKRQAKVWLDDWTKPAQWTLGIN